MIVGFSTTSNPVSTFIRWVTRSQVSHAWFRLKVFETDVALHADFTGVAIVDWNRFSAKNKVVAQYAVALDFDPLMPELMRDLGAPYDFAGLFGQGWVLLGRMFGKRWANPLQRRSSWYCSELVSHVLKEGGEHLPFPPDAMAPQDLMKILADSGLVRLV